MRIGQDMNPPVVTGCADMGHGVKNYNQIRPIIPIIGGGGEVRLSGPLQWRAGWLAVHT
jgi:hypothetical protein